MKDGFPVSVSELIAAGVRPEPAEAAAIVLGICHQVLRVNARGAVLPPITPGTLFLDGGADVTVAGGVPAEDEQTTRLLGRLLLQLLPSAGVSGTAKVPSRLRQLARRAASLDGPRLPVERFAASLKRFCPERPGDALVGLFERWRGRPSAPTREIEPFAGFPERLLFQDADSLLPLSVPRRSRRLAAALLLAGALLLAAGAGGAYWLKSGGPAVAPPKAPSSQSVTHEPPPGDWELLADAVPPADRGGRVDTAAAPGGRSRTAAEQEQTATQLDQGAKAARPAADSSAPHAH
jgi:hypothetical protein